VELQTPAGQEPCASGEFVSDGVAPLEFLRAVLDPMRLSVLAASVHGPVSIQDTAETLGVEPKEVAEAVGNLRSLEILDDEGALNKDALVELARSLPQEHPDLGKAVDGPWTEDEAATLGRFFSGTGSSRFLPEQRSGDSCWRRSHLTLSRARDMPNAR
jgi:hypothetical protein